MHLEKPTETISTLLIVFSVFNLSCQASLQEENTPISVAVPPRQDSEQGIVGKVYGCRHFPNAGSNWEAIEKLRWCPTSYIRISLRKRKDSEEILKIYLCRFYIRLR